MPTAHHAPLHTNEPLVFSQYCWSPQGGVSAAHSSTSGTQQHGREDRPPATSRRMRAVTGHDPQPRLSLAQG